MHIKDVNIEKDGIYEPLVQEQNMKMMTCNHKIIYLMFKMKL